MRKYKIINTLALWLATTTILCSTISCGRDGHHSTPTNKPLNITIYLDLSDRLTRDLQPNQKERDIAIVNKFVQTFKDACVKDKIIRTKNHMRVIFYPSPNSSEIATLASVLEVDMAKLKGKEKKKALQEMDKRFTNSLSQIYDETLKAKKWIGSDIWGFFSNKKVDELCMRNGYRNILVVLTDGYLFHANNKVKTGNAYSYVLPQTLQNPKSSLIVKRKGLNNLEVLMLEVNPYDPKAHDKMQSVLENWFKGMGVKRFVVSETDLASNTATVIENFISQ